MDFSFEKYDSGSSEFLARTGELLNDVSILCARQFTCKSNTKFYCQSTAEVLTSSFMFVILFFSLSAGSVRNLPNAGSNTSIDFIETQSEPTEIYITGKCTKIIC